MIDLDSYEAQAEEGESHVRQIIDVIRELRECRAERDAAIARAVSAEALAASRPPISPELATRAFHGHGAAMHEVRRILDAHGANPKHVHPCPLCYEKPECTEPCSWEADDDTGPLRGAHLVCDACAEPPKMAVR